MTDDFVKALLAERFGPPVPRIPSRGRASAVAIAELLDDLKGAEDEQEQAS